MNKFSLIFIIFLLKSINANDDLDESDYKRVLSLFINPQCDIEQCNQLKNSSNLSIVYVRSSKYKDQKTKLKSGPDFHFILSTYDNDPAFFIVSTANNSDLSINWTKLFNKKEDSIKFLVNNKIVQPKNTIGILISRIFMWLDTEDGQGNYLPNKSEQREILSSEVKWKNATILEQTKDRIRIEFELKDELNNGTVIIRLMIPSNIQKYTDLPRLLTTPKSIHTQLIFSGFQGMFLKNNTNRLGIQMTIVSQGVRKNLTSIDTIDDEDSSGLFHTYKYPFGDKVADSSFLSFKPNAYTAIKKSIAKTIDSKQSSLNEFRDKKGVFLNNSAFYGFYGNSDFHSYQMNITFGSIGQDFYSKTNYTEFNFVLGLGDLPEPEKSFFIKMVIIIGSGLSLLVLLIFPISIYLMAKKMKQRREGSLLSNQDSIY